MQPAGRAIALVDDDRAVRESPGFLLEIAGHRIVDYGSAAEFLQQCDRERVSGLILDHHMPQVSGLELAGELRALGWQLPILLVTGSPSPAIVARAAELGIEKVLAKPPPEGELMAFCGRLGG
jgi:FixJ family two-component response regulator